MLTRNGDACGRSFWMGGKLPVVYKSYSPPIPVTSEHLSPGGMGLESRLVL